MSNTKKKLVALSAALAVAGALAPTVASAAGPVTVDIYSSGGWPAVGTYGPLVGSFTASDVSFGVATGWHWTPFGQNGDFAAVLTGGLNVAAGGGAISVTADDGAYLTIDGVYAGDNWYPHGPSGFTVALSGGAHSFRIDYFECCGNPASGIDVALREATYAVPEPETYAMMLAGLGILGAAARRRKAA